MFRNVYLTMSRTMSTTMPTVMRPAITFSHTTAVLRDTGRPARSETRSIRYSLTCMWLPGLGIWVIPCSLLVLQGSPAEALQSCEWCHACRDDGQKWKQCNPRAYDPATHGYGSALDCVRPEATACGVAPDVVPRRDTCAACLDHVRYGYRGRTGQESNPERRDDCGPVWRWPEIDLSPEACCSVQAHCLVLSMTGESAEPPGFGGLPRLVLSTPAGDIDVG